MVRKVSLGIAAVAVLTICAVAVPHFAAQPISANIVLPKVVLEFHTMVGNGPDEDINGIESDDLPWVIARADGKLLTDGSISLSVRGLVFADDPSVPPELRGKNDEEFFAAVVSCLTEDPNGGLTVVNVPTRQFPASATGNALIVDHIQLPHPCIAPIVFVVGDEGEWLAATGFAR